MEKLYYSTPYVKEFEGKVLRCTKGKQDRYEVVLDRTAFYPEGGGQPSDMGTLGDANVISVHEKGGEIIHYTDRALEEGAQVTGVLDWDRRYRNMQLHSGEHILSGLVHRKYGYDNVGFHMGSEEVTVDFNGVLDAQQLREIELEANQVVYDNVPVLAGYPDEETLHRMDYRSKKELSGQVRIVEIPGGDICACCGTHVERTGEIGIIKATGMISYKGGVRISMLCGKDALLDYEKRLCQIRSISHLLSAKPVKLAEAVEKLKMESERREFLLNQVYQQLFTAKTEAYPESDQPLLVFEQDLMPVQLRRFCTMLYEQGRGSVAAVCSGEDGNWQYALGSAKGDMKKLSRWLNDNLNGRGGGSSLMAQGTWMAGKDQIMSAFEMLKSGECEWN
ncbi:alanyl-tRNA editing protein [Clostridium sp. MCC353]|uniref:alanyl-tRNA editing protein n=1 Tax=Clostridium sp. MCC353 TaxID=2592646 RepID=UPI001C033304|nr:alanyl-tRNA editing protein [Clostridium sp. MCC353]MBT9779840.1 alanyl-tRNA editing protein [Clostridium sp. MCC353]